MSIADLRREARQATSKDVYSTTVALFKQQPQMPRVIAESANYLAYTLKNGNTLRLISRDTNVKASLKAHQKQIHAVRFVNYRSNVAASASADEFFVWVVTNENPRDADPESASLTVKIYFKLRDPVTVSNFSFYINQAVGFPDMLVLYEKKAIVLESSKLIKRYENTMLEASLQTDARELRQLSAPVTMSTLCSATSTGWFAFTSAPTMVMASTTLNRNTPAWAACEGAEVKGLELLDIRNADAPTTLITCSAERVYQWRLTGDAEPALLHRFTFGSSIITLLSCRSTFAVFNDNKEVAVVEVAQDGYRATVYPLPITVRPTSVCFSRATNYCSVLVDTSKEIDIYQLVMGSEGPARPAAAEPAIADSAIIAASAAGTGAVVVPPGKQPPPKKDMHSAAAPTPSAIQNLLQHVQRTSALAAANNTTPSATALPPASQPAALPAVTTTQSSAVPNVAPAGTTATYQAARAALQSAALPHSTDGPLAAATYQGDEAIRAELESLQNILENITQIQKLTPEQVQRDHAQLVSLALEAQMTELQNGTSSPRTVTGSSPIPASAPASKEADDAFNSYVTASLMLPIASDIAAGITRGVNDALRTELDNALRTAFNTSVRESQKVVLKRRLDESLSGATAFFSEEVRKRVREVIDRDLRDAFAQVNVSVNSLIEDNRRLQTALNDVMGSGVLEELGSLRAEVRALREAARSGTTAGASDGVGANPSSFQNHNPTPETILTTAASLLAQNSIAEGLRYIVMAKQAPLTLQLFRQISEEVYSTLISDTTTPGDVWSKLLSQLCTGGFTEAEDIEKVAEIAFDVVSEHNQLTTKSTAAAQQLRSDLRHFATRSKGSVHGVGQRKLRDLEKSIQ